jgi:hypothetical protein
LTSSEKVRSDVILANARIHFLNQRNSEHGPQDRSCGVVTCFFHVVYFHIFSLVSGQLANLPKGRLGY